MFMKKSESNRNFGIPLYLKLKNDFEDRNNQWNQQLSRKELLKYDNSTNLGFSEKNSTDMSGTVFQKENFKGKTFNKSASTKYIPRTLGRLTETNLRKNKPELERVEEISKLNQEIRELERSIGKEEKLLENPELNQKTKRGIKVTLPSLAKNKAKTAFDEVFV